MPAPVYLIDAKTREGQALLEQDLARLARNGRVIGTRNFPKYFE